MENREANKVDYTRTTLKTRYIYDKIILKKNPSK